MFKLLVRLSTAFGLFELFGNSKVKLQKHNISIERERERGGENKGSRKVDKSIFVFECTCIYAVSVDFNKRMCSMHI